MEDKELELQRWQDIILDKIDTTPIEWGYDEFWESLSIGWFQEYIFPYDDPYNITISPERRLRLAEEPERIIVSAEAYDELVRQINEPPDPAVVERIKELMNRKDAPF